MKFVIRLPNCWSPEKIDFLHYFVSQLYDAIWEQHRPYEDIFENEDIPT